MTKYLLDTNAVSEAVKSRQNQGYIRWLSSGDDADMFISCLTIGEIQKGIALVVDPQYKERLNRYLDGLYEAFSGRILTLDVEACTLWGQVMAKAQQTGRNLPTIDSLLAAQCLQHDLTLVTRNTKDFQDVSGLSVLCPWS